MSEAECMISPFVNTLEGRFRVRVRLITPAVGVIRFPLEYAGMVVLTHWFRNANGDTTKKYRRWITYTSIFDVIRATQHSIETYQGGDARTGEQKRITVALGVARQLNALVRKQRIPISPHVNAKRRQLTDQLNDLMAGGRIPEKTEARAITLNLEPGIDKVGRNNPAASGLKARRMTRVLEQRAAEIPRIVRCLHNRLELLANNVRVFNDLLTALNEFIADVLAERMMAGIRSGDVARTVVLKHCLFYAESFDKIDFHPFRGMAWHTSQDLRSIVSFLERRPNSADFEADLTKKLNKLRTAISLKLIQIDVEREYFRWSCSTRKKVLSDLPKLKTRMERLKAKVESLSDKDFAQRFRKKALRAFGNLDAYVPVDNTSTSSVWVQVGTLLTDITASL